MADIKNNDLTPGEKLLINRRRVGMSQSDAAAKHGVPWGVYGRWERDQETSRRVPRVAVGRLKLHEQCMVARLRKGYSQRDLAKRLKLSTFWVRRMERGEIACDRLAVALLGA